MMRESSGKHIALEMPPMDFASYEVWNFIEHVMKVNVEDLSVFRDAKGEPTGIVVAVLKDAVPASRLDMFAGQRFCNVFVNPRLFVSIGSFEKFVRMNCGALSMSVSRLGKQRTVPIVFVSGFEGTQGELRHKFGAVGTINVVEGPAKVGRYSVVYFQTDEAARAAQMQFHGVDGMVVGCLSHRCLEPCFVVRGATPSDVKEGAAVFGCVERMVISRCGDVGVVMDSLEAANAACALLKYNVQRSSDITVYVFFVERLRLDEMEEE